MIKLRIKRFFLRQLLGALTLVANGEESVLPGETHAVVIKEFAMLPAMFRVSPRSDRGSEAVTTHPYRAPSGASGETSP